jgi:23S rRNA pseudouridine1911/1915/1917 synthase
VSEITQSSLLPAEAILFEDNHVLVVNKPAPMLTQAPPQIPSLEAMVKEYIRQKYAKTAGVYLGIPHRLDRPVSGVIVFSRSTKSAQRIHAQFQKHQVRKVYWAAVAGGVSPESGVWDDWVRKIATEAKTVKAEPGEPGAKLATLEYRVLQRLPAGGTLIEFSPLTGRMHQLRVQAAWRGHPVFGDQTYGSMHSFGPPAELPRDRVIALHARRLTFTHPTTNAGMTFEAPLPEYWQKLEVEGSITPPDRLP